MPLTSSKKGFIRDVIKSGKNSTITATTASVVEDLKAHHAEELARSHDEHAMEVELLLKEVDRCRAEVKTLEALSDERSDTLAPLPCPYQSLKFVKNTNSRKIKKGNMGGGGGGGGMAAGGGRNNSNNDSQSASTTRQVVADLKARHQKDLANAWNAYATRMNSMKREVDRYKAEIMEASKKARDVNGGGGGGGRTTSGDVSDSINVKTGVADNDKENARGNRRALYEGGSGQFLGEQIDHKDERHNGNRGPIEKAPGSQGASLDSDNWKEEKKYQRLFMEEYNFEEDTVYQQFVALENNNYDADQEITISQEINDLCRDLNDFMTDVRINTGLGGF